MRRLAIVILFLCAPAFVHAQDVLIKVVIAEAMRDSSSDSRTLLGPATQPAQSFSTLVLDKQHIAALQSLSESGKLNTLSRPYILAAQDRVSKFTIGRTENGDEPIGDLRGLIDFIPHVTADGQITLDISPLFQMPGNLDQTVPSQTQVPLTGRSESKFHLTVHDSQAILIHGLVHQHKTLSLQKIPLLGNLPFFGALFTGQQVTTSDWEVVIVLTPRIATHGRK